MPLAPGLGPPHSDWGTPMATTMSFFTEMVQQITERGRALMGRQADAANGADLALLAEDLMSNVGEATGVARAGGLLQLYAGATPERRVAFLEALASRFGPDEGKVRAAVEAFQADPGPRTGLALHLAAEPRRQDLIRRLNRASGGTVALVRMREDVLAHMKERPALADVDADFRRLFDAWFNRGFLVLRRIDWSSPALVLEKIIRYEAVHRIDSFEDLRHRLEPPDRRLYAFFHPALVDEPLIFVEVALTSAPPDSIQAILDPARTPIPAAEADTAVFYSISNCQKGLAGVSFGSFLIKQVVEELSRDLPQVRTYLTLSPVPGFLAWLRSELEAENSPFLADEEKAALRRAEEAGPLGSEATPEEAHELLRRLAATYIARAKTAGGRPVDPVARFHLGNGARLHRVHARADVSPRGLGQSAGVMVNYLYDLGSIERNHESFVTRGEVPLSPDVRRLAKPARAPKERAG